MKVNEIVGACFGVIFQPRQIFQPCQPRSAGNVSDDVGEMVDAG